MKNKNPIFILILISLIFNISAPLYSEEKDLNSLDKKKETPQALKDLRRFEIITLGALPFVMFDSTLFYSGIKYVQNDFSDQYKPGFNQKYTTQEQTGLILTSIGICVGIGITDFIINLVKRNNKQKRKEVYNNPILITPISQNPEAVKIDEPDFDKNLNNEDKD